MQAKTLFCILLFAISAVTSAKEREQALPIAPTVLPAPQATRNVQPVWKLSLHNALLRDRGGFAGTPEQNRSCGILRWDDAHVLMYNLSSAKRLGVRTTAGVSVPVWTFSIKVVKTEDGSIAQSLKLPAGSVNSELAVVSGGVVESNRDQLIFYSREFKRIDPPFTYAPLHGPFELFRESVFRDPQRLYVTDDGNTLLLLDSSARRSHVFVFDGKSFRLRSDWTLEDADWHRISIGRGGILYGGFETHDRTYWTDFDGKTSELKTIGGPCSTAVYVDRDRLLDVCDGVSLIAPGKKQRIYELSKNQRVELPVVISTAKDEAGIFTYTFKGGGVLDRDEQVTNTGILVINLNENHKHCIIPVVPMPRSQLAFNFAQDATLILLSDDEVTAYRPACP